MELVKCVTFVIIVTLSGCTCNNVHSALISLKCHAPSFHTLPWNSKGYLLARVAFYANSTATFQLELLVAGDINPNPGPLVHGDSEANLASKPDFKINRTHYDRNHLVQLRASGYCRLPINVWNKILALGISKSHRSHRGKRAGRRKQRTIRVQISPRISLFT